MPTEDINDGNQLTSGDLLELAEQRGTCVTILMPTHRTGSDTRQDPIRFRNLLGEAKAAVKDQRELLAALESLESLNQDVQFWRHQRSGLAAFVDSARARVYRVFQTVPEQVAVDECFRLVPLADAIADEREFLVLALTWDDVRLFRASGTEALDVEWSQIENAELPTTFQELITPRDVEEQLQFKSYQSVGNNQDRGTAMFHGHGGGETKIDADRRTYLSRAAEIVSREIYQQRSPVVLVATDEVAGEFRKLIHFTIAGHVAMSPAGIADEDPQRKLVSAALETLGNSRPLTLQSLGERFGTAMASGKASTEVEDIFAAAIQGRIEVVIAARDKQVLGHVSSADQTASRLPPGAESDPNSTDLINRVVIECLCTGADVRLCSSDQMPGSGGELAAIYRY